MNAATLQDNPGIICTEELEQPLRLLLRTHGLTKSFGGLRAVQGVDLEVYAGRILSVIGPNGAGKTTLFNCLTGIYRPNAGVVQLEGRSITGLPPHEISRRGVSRTFQNIRLFSEMTALENVRVAQYYRSRIAPWHILFRTAKYHEAEARYTAEAQELLELVGLGDAATRLAASLPYGLQRRLEIARALATAPRVLLLDEPGAGMNPSEIGEMIALVGRLKQRGLGIVLIEHHMKVVMEISDEILVLDHGEPIAKGCPAAIRQDARVIAAYLGKPCESQAESNGELSHA